MNGFIESQGLWVQAVFGLIAVAMLVLASERAVKETIGIADYFNLSTTFMGMTVLSLATSIPEISSHLTASAGILAGTLDYRIGSSIVLGANIGSDVVQQTLIMGVVVFAAGSLRFRRYFLWKSLMPMIVTTIMCIILGWDRTYSRLDGLILFATFVIYTYFLYWDERRHYKRVATEGHLGGEADIPKTRREVARSAMVSIVAVALTILAAQLVLRITQSVVRTTGIGGSFIGVITLGVASALPELTMALSGLRHDADGVSIGTLVGSNITNPLVAIGGGALLSTYWVPRPLIFWDLPWETVTGALLLGILWFTGGKLSKRHAIYLGILYFVYIGLRGAFFIVD